MISRIQKNPIIQKFQKIQKVWNSEYPKEIQKIQNLGFSGFRFQKFGYQKIQKI